MTSEPSPKRGRKIVALSAAGAIALAGGSLLGTSMASAADTGSNSAQSQNQNFVQQRLSRISAALKGLVSDGTLTQEQADKVASTLAEQQPAGRHGGRGMGMGLRMGQDLTVAAQALNMTEQELRAELDKGTTLATLAQQKGVDKATVINALVDAAKKHLAQEVAEGELTQAQADQISADLSTRITAMVEQGRPAHGEGFGPRGGHGGHGGRGGFGPGAGAGGVTSDSGVSGVTS